MKGVTIMSEETNKVVAAVAAPWSNVRLSSLAPPPILAQNIKII